MKRVMTLVLCADTFRINLTFTCTSTQDVNYSYTLLMLTALAGVG